MLRTGEFPFSGGKARMLPPEPSIPIEDDPLIEDVLEKDVAKKIYERWDAQALGNLLDFGGGEFGITIGHMAELDVDKAARALRMKKKDVQDAIEKCRKEYALQPYR